MTIRTTEGPEGGREIIAHAIAPLFRGGAGIAVEMAEADDGGDTISVQLAAPHPVYTVGLDDVDAGLLLEAAREQGWRYLVLRGEEAVGSATLRNDEQGGGLTFSHVTRGPYVSAMVQAIDAAEAAEEVAGAEYDLRLLDAPAVHLRALWLHADGADLLIPLAPAPGGIEPNRVYTEEALLPALRRLAARWVGQAHDAGG